MASRLARGAPAILGVGVAFAVWRTLPPTLIVFNDDFGYVRSIMETLDRGRPWTDEWLEPWAASLSVLSALIFKLTGSLRAATYGVQAAAVGVMVALGGLLLRARRVPTLPAVAWSLLLVSFPTLLFKVAEFGAVPLYAACLLGAILAAEQRRWAWFAAAWLVAVSSRQSALLWLALPAAALWEAPAPAGPRAAGRGPRLVALALAALLVYGGVQAGMNRTHAQVLMAPAVPRGIAPGAFFSHLGLALAVLVLALGVGAFVLASATAGEAPRVERAARFGAMLVVLTSWAVDIRSEIHFEHDLLQGSEGRAYLTVVCILSLAGWWWGAFRIRRPHLVLAIAMAALVALRPVMWDYYLLDVVVLGLLAPLAVSETPAAAFGRRAGYAAIVALMWLHQASITATKRALDWELGVESLCERALRAGEIGPADLSIAPFGYRGWHLYPYYILHEGRASADAAAFQDYVRPDAIRIEIGDADGAPPASGRLEDGERLLASDVFAWEWSERRQFSLIRRSAVEKALLEIRPDQYVFEPFPLNDAEWRAALAR